MWSPSQTLPCGVIEDPPLHRQAGNQAHCCTGVSYLISHLPAVIENVDLIKDTACCLNPDRLVNRKRREGEEIVVRGRQVGANVSCAVKW